MLQTRIRLSLSLVLTGALAAATLLFGATPASATTLVLGNRVSNNVAPFGGPGTSGAETRYQQVYSAAAFGGGAIALSSLSFEAQAIPKKGETVGVAGDVAGGIFTVSLSTTSKAVNGLDLVNFDANVGADAVTIFSGTLASAYSKPFLTFNIPDFLFAPGAGNLLLDVRISGITTGGATFWADTGSANGVYSRAQNFGTENSNYGLNTTFVFTAANGSGGAGSVPEPAAWAMMLVGFGAVGAVARRRRVALRMA